MALRPLHRRLLTGAVAAVLVLGIGITLLERALEAALRAPVDAYLRARTLRLARVDSAPDLTVSLPVLRLSLWRRRLVLQRVGIRFERQTRSGLLQFEAQAQAVRLTGLDLGDVLWRRTFRLSGVAIERPTLRWSVEGPAEVSGAQAPTDTLPVTLPAPDSVLYRLVSGWLPDAVREGRIDRVRVSGASVHGTERRGAHTSTDSTAGLSLELRGLELDSASHRVFEYGALAADHLLHTTDAPGDSLQVRGISLLVSADDTTFAIEEIRTGATAGGHTFRAVGLRRSHARQVLTVDTVHFAPAGPDSSFFRAAGPRGTRVRALVTGFKALGLRQEHLRHRRVTAGGVWVGHAELDVLADHRLPAGPPRARVLWPARLAALDWVVGVDSLVIEDGAIGYGELYPGRPRAGRVTFERFRGSIYNLRNDSAAVRAAPARLRASALLFGQGPLSAEIEVPVRPGPVAIHARGTIGPMPLAALSAFILPANGLEITAGELASARFAVTVTGGQATGSFAAAWAGLELRLVDPVTGRQSLGRRLKSMVAGRLVRESQQPDRSGVLRSSPIAYTQVPGDSFWGLLWRALRSGMLAAARR